MSAHSEYYLSLPGDVRIGLLSDQAMPLSAKDELLLGAYLPDVAILDAAPAEADMIVQHVESMDKTVAVGKDTVEIRDTWRGEFPDDLPHLLYSVARTLWLQRGYYPTHAACVGDASFTLLPGHSGAGKTTTALATAAEYQQKVLSGNTTLIRFTHEGVMQAVAGTKTMTLRTEDFERGAYDTGQGTAYGSRTAFELKKEQQATAPKAIGKIALVRLHEGANHWSELSPLSALHTLYPYFLDTEYTDCVVAGGNAVYVGDTPPVVRTRLAAMLHQSLADIPVATGIGDKHFLAERIAGL